MKENITLERVEEIQKMISQKLLTIIPTGMINMTVRFRLDEDSREKVLSFTDLKGEIRTHTYEEYQLNKQKIREVSNFVDEKLIEIRQITEDTWVSCFFWTNREGKYHLTLDY